MKFVYPAIEQGLVENSWNEYWKKKQELDKSGVDKDETMNETTKSNFLESKYLSYCFKVITGIIGHEDFVSGF